MLKMLQVMMCVMLVTLVTAGLAGCESGQTSDKDITVVTEDKLPEMLDQPQTVVVDVRTPDRYAGGHLPGAISIPLPDMRLSDARLTGAERIIVYAGGWTDPLSSAGAKRLMALGYSNVYEFKGGVEMWLDSGRKLITSLPEKGARPETSR